MVGHECCLSPREPNLRSATRMRVFSCLANYSPDLRACDRANEFRLAGIMIRSPVHASKWARVGESVGFQKAGDRAVGLQAVRDQGFATRARKKFLKQLGS